MKRYSKKRQAILDCLRSTKTHPTADAIYEELKPKYPDLSLATVYRNLGQFKEEGTIRSVGTVLGQERFDGDVTPHAHVVCSGCGLVTDIKDIPVPRGTVKRVESDTGYSIDRSDLRFTGLCENCRAKAKQNTIN